MICLTLLTVICLLLMSSVWIHFELLELQTKEENPIWTLQQNIIYTNYLYILRDNIYMYISLVMKVTYNLYSYWHITHYNSNWHRTRYQIGYQFINTCSNWHLHVAHPKTQVYHWYEIGYQLPALTGTSPINSNEIIPLIWNREPITCSKLRIWRCFTVCFQSCLCFHIFMLYRSTNKYSHCFSTQSLFILHFRIQLKGYLPISLPGFILVRRQIKLIFILNHLQCILYM